MADVSETKDFLDESPADADAGSTRRLACDRALSLPAGEVTRAGRAAELVSRTVRRDTCMSAENEKIIRRVYQRAEEKDVEGFIACFTGDGTFTD